MWSFSKLSLDILKDKPLYFSVFVVSKEDKSSGGYKTFSCNLVHSQVLVPKS